jgi:hypothetical protein
MPRCNGPNGGGGRSRLLPLLLLLLLVLVLAAVTTVVQAFVPNPMPLQRPRAVRMMMAAEDGLDSRRGSLQRTGAWGLAGAAALLLGPVPLRPSPALAAGGDPREALMRVIVVSWK